MTQKRRHICYSILDLISDREAYTADDIAHELGISPVTATEHLRELWALDLVYICSWDRTYHNPVRVYRFGNRPDVERPEPRTHAEVQRNFRKRLKEKQNDGHSQSAATLHAR